MIYNLTREEGGCLYAALKPVETLSREIYIPYINAMIQTVNLQSCKIAQPHPYVA